MIKIIITLSMIVSFAFYNGDYIENKSWHQLTDASLSSNLLQSMEEVTLVYDREIAQQINAMTVQFIVNSGTAVQYRVRTVYGLVNGDKFSRNTINQSFVYTTNDSMMEDQILIEIYNEKNQRINTKVILVIKNEYGNYDVGELIADESFWFAD